MSIPTHAVFKLFFSHENNNTCGSHIFKRLTIDNNERLSAKTTAIRNLKNIYNITVSKDDIELHWPEGVNTAENFRKLSYDKRHIKIHITSPEKIKEFGERLKHQIPKTGTTSIDPVTPFQFSFSVPNEPSPENEDEDEDEGEDSPSCLEETTAEVAKAVAKERIKMEEVYKHSINKMKEGFQQQIDQLKKKHEQRLNQLNQLKDQLNKDHQEELELLTRSYEDSVADFTVREEECRNTILTLTESERMAKSTLRGIYLRILAQKAVRKVKMELGNEKATRKQIQKKLLEASVSLESIGYLNELVRKENKFVNEVDIQKIESIVCEVDDNSRHHLDELFQYTYGRLPRL